MFRALTARVPDQAESRILARLFDEQRALFMKRPDDAARLVGVGESRPTEGVPAVDLAAMTAVAQSYTSGTGLSDFNDGFHAAFYGAAVVAVVGGLAALAFVRAPRQA